MGLFLFCKGSVDISNAKGLMISFRKLGALGNFCHKAKTEELMLLGCEINQIIE
jgi:hypothetical protein